MSAACCESDCWQSGDTLGAACCDAVTYCTVSLQCGRRTCNPPEISGLRQLLGYNICVEAGKRVLP